MTTAVQTDTTDQRILGELQQDCDVSVAELGERVNLSTNACWRRIKRLEQEGYIRRRVALLDARKLGADVVVFVSIRAAEHSEAWLSEFTQVVRSEPEVTEFYRMSGDVDYLLKVQVADIAAYDRFYQRLIRAVRIRDVSSTFAMEELKFTTALPLSSR